MTEVETKATSPSKEVALLEAVAAVSVAAINAGMVTLDAIPAFVSTLRNALEQKGLPVAEVKLKPAIDPRKSVTDDYIVCLEDGKQFKSLKRHLMTH